MGFKSGQMAINERPLCCLSQSGCRTCSRPDKIRYINHEITTLTLADLASCCRCTTSPACPTSPATRQKYPRRPAQKRRPAHGWRRRRRSVSPPPPAPAATWTRDRDPLPSTSAHRINNRKDRIQRRRRREMIAAAAMAHRYPLGSRSHNNHPHRQLRHHLHQCRLQPPHRPPPPLLVTWSHPAVKAACRRRPQPPRAFSRRCLRRRSPRLHPFWLGEQYERGRAERERELKIRWFSITAACSASAGLIDLVSPTMTKNYYLKLNKYSLKSRQF